VLPEILGLLDKERGPGGSDRHRHVNSQISLVAFKRNVYFTT
jgi:hypothetical protein